jgi:epoxyqueuosine reductase
VSGLFEKLTGTARAHGFPLAGALDLDRVSIDEHVTRYDDWLAKGYFGAMEYLKRGRDRRADPRIVFPEAKSILCVAIPYPRGAVGSDNGPRYARYLNGSDYHNDIAEKLDSVMTEVAGDFPDLRWKVCVDTSAVLERSWAALAGLGWIGKNTLLIHPKLGSYLFLAEVLINAEVGRGPAPIPNLCGHCTRCLEACPSKALLEASVLDATRCIAYWTLEKRGELALSEEDRRAVGSWVAGCDICQEVCPFNLKPSRAETASDPAGAIRLQDWRELLEEEPEAYRERTRNSALKRVKPEQFSRNLAIALANQPMETLQEVQPLIRARIERETDAVALRELSRCLL